MVKQKSLAQLRREIATQRKRIAKQQSISTAISERQRLSKELFELKNRRLLEAGSKARRLSQRFGRGIIAAGKKIAPVLQKQARLIRDQQLRDEAITKRVSVKTIPKPKKRKKSRKKSRRKSGRKNR